jgi:hypothetical protein
LVSKRGGRYKRKGWMEGGKRGRKRRDAI